MFKTLNMIYIDTARPGKVFANTQFDGEIQLFPQTGTLKFSGVSGTGEGGSTAYLADAGWDGSALSNRVYHVLTVDTPIMAMSTFVDPGTAVPGGATLVIEFLIGSTVILSTTYTAGQSGHKTDTAEGIVTANVADKISVRVTTTGSVASAMKLSALVQ